MHNENSQGESENSCRKLVRNHLKNARRKIQVAEIAVHMQNAGRCEHVFPSLFPSRVVLSWAEGECEIWQCWRRGRYAIAFTITPPAPRKRGRA